jgi:ATP-dependent helicase/nuclease subunit A
MTLPPDQPTRARVLRDFDTTLLLEAGAGTGKTTVLVSRILALVRSGRAPLDRIVAITFTEKAAGELKLRLREEIEAAIDAAKSDQERERLKAASFDLERAPVSTIHAFAAGLLRERPFEAGLDPGFQVAAEIAGERVLEDTWDAWFDARMAEADPTLVRALTLGLKIDQLRTAARRMASERDILGSEEPRPPFSPESLRDRVKEAVATLKPLKHRCTNEADDAYQQIQRLEAFQARADRADGLALERLQRELYVVAHKGQQGNWNPKEACKDVKAELKALKTAQEAYVQAENADLAWALRLGYVVLRLRHDADWDALIRKYPGRAVRALRLHVPGMFPGAHGPSSRNDREVDALQLEHLSNLLRQGQGPALLPQCRLAGAKPLQQLGCRKGPLDRPADAPRG